MSVVSSVSKIGEVIATWLDPVRRERATLLRAIEAGEELMKVIRRKGEYADMSYRDRLKEERHYQKRWDSWKDGKG